jgi:hypothetical protein
MSATGLNTRGVDFHGGEIRFPLMGRSVDPIAGRLVGFRCDTVHTHEAPPVAFGVRRALAFWCTFDQAHARTFG